MSTIGRKFSSAVSSFFVEYRRRVGRNIDHETPACAPVNLRERDVSLGAIEADVQYALKIGYEYLRLLNAAGVEVIGKHVLEIGPGINYGSVLILACYGAQLAIVDRFEARWNESYHVPLYTALRDAVAARDSKADLSPLDRLLAGKSHSSRVVKTVNSGAEDLSAFSNESIDIVLSNAALEHVQVPHRVARELWRITSPGGVGVHQIDFRDHRDFDAPLEYLLLSPVDFRTMFDERHGECGGQTRHYEWRDHFERAGFNIHWFDPNMFAEDRYLNEFLPRLIQARESLYRNAARKDLRVVSGRFLIKKIKS